jgi:hypothetical protein
VTLNAVDHTQIRSVDRETLDSPAPHSQIQARKAASITEFGLDVDQDLLRAVTGIPAREGAWQAPDRRRRPCARPAPCAGAHDVTLACLLRNRGPRMCRF